MERENDAGCYFSHYQLPHNPANAGFQGIERQQKKELPVAAITEAKWYDICVCVLVRAHTLSMAVLWEAQQLWQHFDISHYAL